AAAHCPSPTRASARSSRAQRSSAQRSARRRPSLRLLKDQLAGLAIDAAQWIDHLLVAAVQRPFDGLVEPAIGAAPIDEVRGKARRRIREREDRVLLVGRRAREPERRFLAIAAELRKVDAIGTRLDTQEFVILHRALHHLLAGADEHAAAIRQPLLAEIALVDGTLPAPGKPRERRDGTM